MDQRKRFQRKAYGLKGLDNFFSHLSNEFLVLPLFVVVFKTIRLIVMSYRWLMNNQHHSFPSEAKLNLFIGFL